MNQTLRNARWASLSIFFINGVLLSSWVPHIPLVQEKLGLGEGLLGLALLGMAIGALVAMPLSGYLSSRLGSRPVTTFCAFSLCLSLIFPILAPNLPLLILALMVFGASNGALDVAMNAQAVAVEKRFSKPIMSSFHGFFSLGGLTGSGLGGLALASGVSEHLHVFFVAGLMSIAILLTFRAFLAKEADASKTGSSFVRPTGPLLGLGILAFLVLVAEGAMADWTAVYLKNVLGTGPGLAAAGYAAFSLMMALGRLSGDRLVAGMGPVIVTRITSVIAACGLGIALFLHHPAAAIFGFGAVGLGLSNLVPVLFSAAGRTPGVASSTGIAAVATAGYFGFLAGPPLIGFVAEVSSLRFGLGLVVAAIFIVTLNAGLTRKADTQEAVAEQVAPSGT